MQEKITVMKKQIPSSSNSFLFRKSYIHSKIPTDYPQNPWGFITVSIPIPYPYHGNPHGNPHTHGSPGGFVAQLIVDLLSVGFRFVARVEFRCTVEFVHDDVLYSARFEWMANDPEIVSDVLFAVANVLSIARTTYLMPAFEVLGTLQISLVRMIGDIARFIVLFTLVCISSIRYHKPYSYDTIYVYSCNL